MHVHLDPRTVILSIVLLIVATFRVTHPVSLFGFSLLLLFVLVSSRTPLRVYVRNLGLLFWFFLFTFFAYTWDGGVAASSWENVFAGMQAIGQLSIVVGWATILGNYASPLVLVSGLERLLQPLRVLSFPVSRLSVVTMLSLHFFPVLLEESQHLLHAYIARGIEIHHGNIRTRLRNYVLLCGPLLNGLFRRVEHLTLAMESRAFHVEGERTSRYTFQMTWIDYLCLAGNFLLLLAVSFYG